MEKNRRKKGDRGIWKKFFNMIFNSSFPVWSFLFYVILHVLEGQILIRVPEANADLFSGDVSVEAVLRFVTYELLVTGTSQIVLYFNHILRYKMNRNLRNTLWGKILHLKPSYYDKVSSASLLSRITVDSDSINEFMIDVVWELVYQIYYIALTIMEMNRISIRVGLMLLAFMPLSFITTFIMSRIEMKFNEKMKGKLSDLTVYLSELISCMPLMKSMNRQKRESERGRKIIDDYYNANLKITGLSAAHDAISSVIGIGPELVIMLVGINFLNDGTFDGAAWYVFYLYAGTFIALCSTFMSMWTRTKSIQGSLVKVSDILYEKEEGITDYVRDIVDSGDIIFDHVDFSYEEENKVFDDTSFTIPGKKVTALVGYSGSGKTTALKLIERFYDPDGGRILMGGEDISHTDIKKYRKKLAFVSQNTPLMSGTVRDNILYGIDREVSDDEIIEASRLTHLYSFIMEDPDGLSREVGNLGEKLSGGQRQKISLTRALLSNADILILDEPTASLDIVSTNEIRETVKTFKGKKTILIVTHDRGMANEADHVIVMSKGKRTVSGSQEDALKQSEFYRRFINGEVSENEE